MADYIYNAAKESFLDQNPSLDLDTNTIKVGIYSTSDYTNAATHTNFATNAFTNYGASTDQTLSSKTVTDGTFDDGGTVTFSSLAQDAAKTIDGLIIYQDGGTDATRYYIAHIDSFTSVTPNGGDITITWNASGIFAL